MASHADRKEAIVSAAAELFARFGLEKTTMEDIAAAARKAKSSLYYYFQSKEEVFAEVIKREISGLQQCIREAVAREDDPYSRFRALVKARLSHLSETQDTYTTIREEHLKHYNFIRDLTEDHSAWEIAAIQDIVEYGRDQGAFKVTDATATARALYFALKSLEYPWTINLEQQEIEHSVDHLIDILLSGISIGSQT